MSVLDVGTFDGFYAFLAEARGARRIVAVDNEQYREWVSSRWGVELEGGEGSPRSGSYSTPRSTTAGSTHSIWTSSLRRSTSSSASGFSTGWRTRWACSRRFGGASRPADGCCSKPTARRIGLSNPRRRFTFPRQEVYARDDFVYWGFTPAGLDAMARHAGFEGFELIDAPVIDGHPRVLGGSGPAHSTDRGPRPLQLTFEVLLWLSGQSPTPFASLVSAVGLADAVRENGVLVDDLAVYQRMSPARRDLPPSRLATAAGSSRRSPDDIAGPVSRCWALLLSLPFRGRALCLGGTPTIAHSGLRGGQAPKGDIFTGLEDLGRGRASSPMLSDQANRDTWFTEYRSRWFDRR